MSESLEPLEPLSFPVPKLGSESTRENSDTKARLANEDWSYWSFIGFGWRWRTFGILPSLDPPNVDIFKSSMGISRCQRIGFKLVLIINYCSLSLCTLHQILRGREELLGAWKPRTIRQFDQQNWENDLMWRRYGYGSIPISTIFRVMNIHLPAILRFTRGTRFWSIPICNQTMGKNQWTEHADSTNENNNQRRTRLLNLTIIEPPFNHDWNQQTRGDIFWGKLGKNHGASPGKMIKHVENHQLFDDFPYEILHFEQGLSIATFDEQRVQYLIYSHKTFVTGWCFGTWLLWLSIGNFIIPLTKSMIFQRGSVETTKQIVNHH